ncbi:MAG: cysteine synthase family protein [Candidatus Omnitrophica bacterium]|nr:cysteine synthase family protein [Candidatus Omnitrophota bacterium]
MKRFLLLLLAAPFLFTGCTKKPQASDILQAIGHTPLLEIDGIYAKAEMLNPSGSIKDRMVDYLIRKAEERGDLKPGQEIIELTSGNTGVALAMISAIKGYKFTAVLPESIDIDKKRIMRLFGADLILTPAKDGFPGAKKKYDEICIERPEAWLPKQFENSDGIEEHQLGIGREIVDQMNGQVDAFVAGVGTGGTLIGVAKALKKVNPNVKIIAVEPAESPVMSGGKPGIHRIEGIGDGFIPKIIIDNRDLIDEVVLIKSEDAIKMAKELARKHGLLVGIASGANVLAAKKVSAKYNNVVTILTDGGERYLSVFFEEEK